MRFTQTPIPGAYVLEMERKEDERGYFARSWCADEFRNMGLEDRIAQCSVSFNHRRGTVRGMHYQLRPHEEAKVVRCTRGRIFDVIVDIRPQSARFGEAFSIELNSANGTMLYIPEGVAHGFQTLEDRTEVFYQIATPYHPESAGGFRWNDKAFHISWPLAITIISDRDRTFPDFPL